MKRAGTAILFAALLMGACARERTIPVESYPGAPVVLISIDALRSDHLPAYGYRHVRTPNIDAFRRDSVLFLSAWSHCPMTLPSHVSMLTGLLPVQHGVRDDVGFRFDGTVHDSLPSILRGHGYATGAAVSSSVLRGEAGLGPLFDVYDDAIEPQPGATLADPQRPGSVTERRAEKWIAANAGKPFFYFFHIYEPNVPQDPPEPFHSRYRSHYDGEIATSDAIVGNLLAFLKTQGIYDRAIVILTSDHGEGLGEHGEQQHAILVYRETLQVPLLVKLPHSRFRGRETAATAQLADLMPTVLGLLGIPVPKESSQTSLLSLLEKHPPARQVYAESLYPRYHFGWSELRSLIDSRWQLIQSSKPELYDLQNDPAEKRDVAGGQRRVVASMKQTLANYGTAIPSIGSADPETASKLAALGYIGSARDRESGLLPNPRDEIASLEEFDRGLELQSKGRGEEAIAVFRSMVARAPSMQEAWGELTRAFVQSGRLDEAVVAGKEGLARANIFEPDLALTVAELDLDLGNLDDASKLANVAVAESPRRGRALLFHIALARKDLATANAFAQAAASAADPLPADILLTAEVSIARGDAAAALEAVDAAARRATDLEFGKVYGLEFLRAEALARAGRVGDAKQAYRREIELFPNDVRAYANLAVLEFVSGKRRASEAVLAAMMHANPTPAARDLAKKTRQAFIVP